MIYPYTINQVVDIFDSTNIDALIGSYDDALGASNFLPEYKNLFHNYTHQTASEEDFTFWGACSAIRHSIFYPDIFATQGINKI